MNKNIFEKYFYFHDFFFVLGDDGYELVRSNSKRSRSGFERLTFSSSSAASKKHDPGYETVRDPPPLPRHHPGKKNKNPVAKH